MITFQSLSWHWPEIIIFESLSKSPQVKHPSFNPRIMFQLQRKCRRMRMKHPLELKTFLSATLTVQYFAKMILHFSYTKLGFIIVWSQLCRSIGHKWAVRDTHRGPRYKQFNIKCNVSEISREIDFYRDWACITLIRTTCHISLTFSDSEGTLIL